DWWQAQREILGQERPPSVQLLHEFLRAEHAYPGSYKSVRKFVRAHYGVPAPSLRKPTLRNPCGCQSGTITSTRGAESVGHPEILRKIMAYNEEDGIRR